MSFFYVSIISACTLMLPLLAMLLRWKWMKDTYLPLIFLLMLGIMNEIISYVMIRYHSTNNINGNIYTLIDFILLFWLFKRLSVSLSKKFIYTLLVIGCLVWALDNMLIHSLANNNSIFRMTASLFIVIISVDKLNQLLFFRNAYGNRNTDMLLSIGVLSYYSYKTFIESFNVFPMPISRSSFYIDLWVTLDLINIVMNLMFTAAIICIPQKQASTIPLS